MNPLASLRDVALARGLAARIAATVDPAREYRLMEFCGGHTHAIYRYGLPELLPPNIRFVHGPGCPVCVLPTARLDQAIVLAMNHPVTLCTYGDLLRVPGGAGHSLLAAKAAGADIRVVYSTQDALALARQEPRRAVVFLAIGFETTAPATAVALQQAQAERRDNFFVLCNHVLTPPALRAILADDETRIDGILGPAHVSTVIGAAAYEFVAAEFGLPLVVAGFEPLDLLQSVLWLVAALERGTAPLLNQYRRAVSAAGNLKAQELLARTFAVRPRFAWRGLGELPDSALRLADDWAAFDAERHFPVAVPPTAEPRGCACPRVLRGLCEPTDCTLFGAPCTPERPIGACMVSAEGACAAYWHAGRRRALPEHTDTLGVRSA